jgi:hypothetical protein
MIARLALAPVDRFNGRCDIVKLGISLSRSDTISAMLRSLALNSDELEYSLQPN